MKNYISSGYVTGRIVEDIVPTTIGNMDIAFSTQKVEHRLICAVKNMCNTNIIYYIVHKNMRSK